LTNGLNPVEQRHGNIDNKDVGTQSFSFFHQSPSVFNGSDKVKLRLKKTLQSLKEDPVIIRQQDASFAHGLSP
jgi:hypothetical protein